MEDYLSEEELACAYKDDEPGTALVPIVLVICCWTIIGLAFYGFIILIQHLWEKL